MEIINEQPKIKLFLCLMLLFTSSIYLNLNISYGKISSVIFGVGECKPYVDKDDIDGGSVTKIVREALLSQNVLVGLQYQPWSRAYAMTKEGYLDGTFPWIKTKEREKIFLFSQPLAKGKVTIFFNKEKPIKVNFYLELAGLTIGGTTGYNYGDELTSLIKNKAVNYIEAYSDFINS